MNSVRENLCKALWMANFLCLGFILSQWAALWYARHWAINSQTSILLLLIFSPASAWLGNRLHRVIRPMDKAGREAALLPTFIFTAGALNAVFAPGSGPHWIFLFPFIFLAGMVYMPGAVGPPGSRLENAVTFLCQIAALALLIPVGSGTTAGAALGLGIWLCLYWVFGRKNPSAMALVLSPVMILWLFLNASNQLAHSHAGWSLLLACAGGAVYVGLTVAGILCEGRFPGFARMSGRAALAFFAAGMILEINNEAGMSTPLQMLDFHWWIHVAPGLDVIFKDMKPFADYIPFEGFLFETMIPRMWFEVLDWTMGGYFVFMALLCFASQAAFAVLLYFLLTRVLEAGRFASGFVAAVLMVSNLSMLQTGFPFPGAWTIAERSLPCFVCSLLFLQYWMRRGAPSRTGAVMLGAAHAVSFFYEPLFGLAGLAGLGSVLLFCRSSRNKAAVLAGGAGTLVLFLAAFRIPAYNFFIHQPAAMIASGSPGVTFEPGRHIFEIFERGRLLSTFHYSGVLALLALFLALAPTRMRRNKFFGLGLYFFTATLFMYVSGGQRLFGAPGGSFATVQFAAMASVLALPLAICLARVMVDALFPEKFPAQAVLKALLVLTVLAAFTDGLFYGSAPGPLRAGIAGRPFSATTWKEQEFFIAPQSNSIPAVLEYYYQYKSRKQAMSGPKPLAVHHQPYSSWKNSLRGAPPIEDVRGFLSGSRPVRPMGTINPVQSP